MHAPAHRRWCFQVVGEDNVTEADGCEAALTAALDLADHIGHLVDVGYNDGDRWLHAAAVVPGREFVITVAMVPRGTTIMHPAWTDGEPDMLDVVDVSLPDADGMVVVSHTGGAIRVNAETFVDVITTADADAITCIVLDEQAHWLR